MGKKRKHLSHEEIWDDSALLDSWEAALEEYQLYHSIHARGERVEDVLKEAEESEDMTLDDTTINGNPSSDAVNGLPHSEDLEDGELEDGQVGDDLPAGHIDKDDAIMPNLSTLTVQDPDLKNLMMSWYYAGYYTGLYEGRKQSNNNGTIQEGKTVCAFVNASSGRIVHQSAFNKVEPLFDADDDTVPVATILHPNWIWIVMLE
ncbi:MAG: hypothetical protein Q9222_004440 [Ikaeria aurantiellina]